MTITSMAQFIQQNYKTQNIQSTPQLPNGSLPPSDHVNPYCPKGMDITGRTDHRRMIPVDEGVANKIKSLVYESMVERGGMNDGTNQTGDIINSYVMTLPPEKRAAAGWTLSQIHLQEANRLGEYVHQKDPSWNWGKPVKPGILEGYQSGIDLLA